jgi:antirestriction protein ArdC
MSLRLYEIAEMLEEAIAAAEAAIDTETGEIPEDWAKFLDDIQMERDEKCLNVARYIKSCSAEADAIAAEVKRLNSRKKAAENKAKRMKEYLKLTIASGEKLSDGAVKISWRKSTATIVYMPEALADKYCKIERTPKLTEIKAAIEAGLIGSDIAEIETNSNIVIQ